MKKYTGSKNLINGLGERCYNENEKPDSWNETYKSKYTFIAGYVQETDSYVFECPDQFQLWLESQPEFVDLTEIQETELIIE